MVGPTVRRYPIAHWPVTGFGNDFGREYATDPPLIVVLTIIFTLACGADNTTPVPAAGTPPASPAATPGGDRRACRNAHYCSRGVADTVSGGHAHRISRSVAQGRTDASAGPDENPEADICSYRDFHASPFPHCSCDSHGDADTNGYARSDAHAHSSSYSCAHGNTYTSGHQVANHTADDNTSSPAPGAEHHLAITVAEVPEDIPDYDRGEWKHWTNADRDCQDARQEVLIEESLEAVTFETEKERRVSTGRWWAPYLAHHLGNPGLIDVDHHVPLKNAHLSGRWRWDAATKEAYANYLESPDHLIAISARHNRSKGARGPDEWKPPDQASWCQYALAWTETKHSWELTMTPSEHGAIATMLATCDHPIEIRIVAAEHPDNLAGEDNTPPTDMGALAMWDDNGNGRITCAEDRAHGIAPVHRGHPAYEFMRDADGDGVVCE